MPEHETKVTQQMAEFVAKTRFEDLPPEVVHEATRLLLDTVGCALGAVGTPSGGVALEYANALGGAPTATVLGLSTRSSATTAAYVNARLANVLDADDTFPTTTHFGNTTVFSALALAEQFGRTGRELITAIAVGFDVGARIGSWMGPPFRVKDGEVVGWNELGGPAGTMTWAAVGAAASMAGLDPLQTEHAFGIAGANSPLPTIRKWAEGTTQSMFKYADAGWCAQTGVSAALLAGLGSTGFAEILDGENAFWRLYGSPTHDDARLLGGLGVDWQILNTTYKPWPCCRLIHHPLTAFTRVMSENDLRPEEIERVVVRVNQLAMTQIFREQQPVDALTAEFSHPHAIALAAYGVEAGPLWFEPNVVSAPHVRDFRSRVTVELEPTAKNIAELMRGGQWRALPGGVDVFARGTVYSATADYAIGDPWSVDTVMSDNDLITKFKAMVGVDAATPDGSRKAARVDACIEAILAAPQSDEVEPWMRSLRNIAAAS
jgi:2-methylcitrate dehydratase PrpD